MQDFVNVEWLKDHMNESKVRIVDCRFQLGNPGAGKNFFLDSHIPDSIYFDLEKDLSGEVGMHGGRHPLPDLSQFQLLLENAGIENDTQVIAYDNGELAFASRLWWLLKYVGHENVFILNGGYKAWQEAGFPVQTDVNAFEKTNYTLNIRSEMLATYEDVKEVVDNDLSTAVLIDSRESKRYLGIEELIDKKAGHIPGAINKVWTEGIENGIFKTSDEQKARFSDLKHDNPVIVYCGSGVTATPNVLALKSAGFKNIKLYLGSFSDWISYDDNPIETGE